MEDHCILLDAFFKMGFHAPDVFYCRQDEKYRALSGEFFADEAFVISKAFLIIGLYHKLFVGAANDFRGGRDLQFSDVIENCFGDERKKNGARCGCKIVGGLNPKLSQKPKKRGKAAPLY